MEEGLSSFFEKLISPILASYHFIKGLIFGKKIVSKITPEVFKMFSKKDPYLDYSLLNALRIYNKEQDWLSTTDNRFCTPYLIIVDYKYAKVKEWGSYSFIEASDKKNFSYPVEIRSLKDYFVRRFEKEDKLGKGNTNCPRVFDYIYNETTGEFRLILQEATYHDQVGTNLVLDFNLNNQADLNNPTKQSNLRDWDIVQSGTASGKVPSFAKSKLANTIGVAIGITAINKNLEEVIIVRKRKNVAVFGNKYHLPFTFALKKQHIPVEGSIQTLLGLDAKEEEMEEIGFALVDETTQMKPLLFCREMVRGGKPQFFFEVSTNRSVDTLKTEIGEKPSDPKLTEYQGGILAFTLKEILTLLKKKDLEFSPELLAFICYKVRESNASLKV